MGGADIKRTRYLTTIAFAVALVASALLSGGAAGDHYVPPLPPAEHDALYSELSQGLTDLETQLDSEWDGSFGPGRFAAGVTAANGNKSVGLLSGTTWTRVIEMLDAFETMGVELVKIDTHYPVLTPAFHTYLQANPPPLVPNYTYNVDNFIGYPASFYNKLTDEIRGRGLGLWIEHSTLFSDWSTTPPGGYFADMRAAGVDAARDRYLQERAAETVLIASELAPDYFTLVDEPTTQNTNFGYFAGGIPILTPDGWRDLVQDAAADIAASVPGYTSLLGAGSGTWEGRGYTERFAALVDLDYVDFHLYPLASTGADFAQNVLDWADYVRSVDPTKKLTLGEAWLYKASAAEISNGLDYNVIFGRDTYSFWEPLDSRLLDVLFKIAHHKQFDAVMPYWTQYYFAYLTFGDPELEGMSGVELVTRAGQDALPNIASVTLTHTGEKLVDLIAATRDTDGDGILDAADANDDNDLLADAAEAACGSDALAAASLPERLDGPFAGVDDDADTTIDEALPAGASGFDCDADGFKGSAEDHVFSYLGQTNGDQKACQEYDLSFPGGAAHIRPSKRWPADLAGINAGDSSFNRINLQDLSVFVIPIRYLNQDVGTDAGDVRLDLVPGSVSGSDINIADMAALTSGASAYPPMLAGSRAFSGPPCPWPS